MKITVLAAHGRSTAILLNWLLAQGYTDLDVIIERPTPYLDAALRRARRHGWATALGQVMFRVLIVPLLSYRSAKRVQDLLDQNGLDPQFPPIDLHATVNSVNNPVVVTLLKSSAPDVVIVNGTGIIKTPVLSACDVPFINTHVGITPQYRGVHGGYWALWNSDPHNFGATLHLVDRGVDTGSILFQARMTPQPQDNFATYPVLQQAGSFIGLAAILKTLAKHQPLIPLAVGSDGTQQWFHPTLLQYLTGRLRGIR